MAFLTSIIDIDSIQVKEIFDSEQKSVQIRALADTISELGGLVNIPVVQQIGVDDYELVSGYLEYYAYLKAREINSQLPDRLTVFVSNSKNRVAIHKQLEVLQLTDGSKKNTSQSKAGSNADIDLQFKNLESFVQSNNRAIYTTLDQLRQELLAAIETRLPQPIPPLEAFNRILEPEIAFKVQRKLEFLGVGTAKKVVAQLQEARKRENGQGFRSFSEILDRLKVKKGNKLVRLVSQERMIMIIDRWNE